MITDLNINFNCEGLNYTINVPSEDDNLPFNLAEAVKEVIEHSNANPDIIIEELEEECGIPRENILSISEKPVLTYKIIENMSDGEMHIFLINVKTEETKPKEEDDVEEVNFYTLDEIEDLIKNRTITDPKTLISFFLYKDMIR